MRPAHLQGLADRRAERRRRRRTIISGASGGGCRRPGEAAIFDRSWYGRVLVERVEGFASEAEWRRAYDEINELEAQLSHDGATIVKLFFHVTQEEQDERFEKRLDHPWKRWKVTAEDLRNRARRADYLAAIKDMFDQTDTRWAPWTVIDGNDKKAARIAALDPRRRRAGGRASQPTRRRSAPSWSEMMRAGPGK